MPPHHSNVEFRKVQALADNCGYDIEYRPLTYVKGWPQPSTRPYLLQCKVVGHIASYGNLAALERGIRARAGC